MAQKGLHGEQWGPWALTPCVGCHIFLSRIVSLVRFDAEGIAIKPGRAGKGK
jgi:hypothetical protein